MVRFFTLFILILYTSCRDLEDYCTNNGGKVVQMKARFDTHTGSVNGYTMDFCRINKDSNLAYVELRTLGSNIPSLAATYVKRIRLDPDKKIFGPFNNLVLNLCYSLGGANIVYYILDGGFSDPDYGDSGVCVFGDGSAISDWTLFYIGNGLRSDIKEIIKAEPLKIDLPTIQ